MRHIINIVDGVTRMPAWRMAEPVNFTLDEGENMAIVGPNGGGKSMLVDIIIGRHPLLHHDPDYDFAPSTRRLVADNIKYMTFRDAYGGDNDRTYYLQQRWNQQEIDPSTPTVGERLEKAFAMTGADTPERRALQQRLYTLFHLEPSLDKYIISLSSGELRKLKLTEVLLSAPRVLIMDNPFIGLDSDTRLQLRTLLQTLAEELSLQVILVLSRCEDIPPFVSHVVEVDHLTVKPKLPLADYLMRQPPVPPHVLSDEKVQAILHLPCKDSLHDAPCCEVVKMTDVQIRYGTRTILDRLSWTVRAGEHWVLSGQNGSGKSTLLSLVCADNPQSYACDISLFGVARGSGESIWDIKRRIGYVSPEMHRAYQRDLPALHIVASGLKDSIGLYVKPNPSELGICRFWMGIFGLEGLEDRTFLSLSSGEQRLVLLARAFVKDPDLLILDEPLHGLDNRNRRLAKDVIETFCQRPNKTLMMVSHYEDEYPACIDHRLQLKRNE